MYAVLLIHGLVGKGELRIRGDDSNLTQVLEDLGAVVLPVAQNSHSQFCPLEVLAVALFTH